MESRVALKNIFPGDEYDTLRVGGIDMESMAAFFRNPFKDEPSVNWDFKEKEKEFVFQWLGDKKKKGGAHGALAIIKRAESSGCANEYIQRMKAKIEKAKRGLESGN
ncbi:MAG: hypothetical protein GY757_46395 [bacterium]|nr:hypothetical protein [bacterium]